MGKCTQDLLWIISFIIHVESSKRTFLRTCTPSREDPEQKSSFSWQRARFLRLHTWREGLRKRTPCNYKTCATDASASQFRRLKFCATYGKIWENSKIWKNMENYGKHSFALARSFRGTELPISSFTSATFPATIMKIISK